MPLLRSPLCLRKRSLLVLCALFPVFAAVVSAALEELPKDSGTWKDLGVLMPGLQYDVSVDRKGQVVILGSELIAIDVFGRTKDSEDFGDPRQDALDMPPALSIDPEGGYHMVTRFGGSLASGHAIRYWYRSPSGGLTDYVLVSGERNRNYCVGVVGVNRDLAYVAMTTAGSNVWGSVRLFRVESGEVTELGAFTGVWRADNRIEMRRVGDRIYLTAGNNDPNGSASLMTAMISDDPFADLNASKTQYRPAATGNARRGFPVLNPHPDGGIDFVMGTQLGRLYYAQAAAGDLVGEEDLRMVFHDLGEWHLSIGYGAGASSADRSVVVVAAIRSDGGASGAGPLVARVSYDGGRTFGPEIELYERAEAGEGRVPVRVVPVGSTFYVFCGTSDGVACSTFTAFPRKAQPTAFADGNDIVFVGPGTAGRRFAMNLSSDFSEWTQQGPVFEGAGGQLVWRIKAAEEPVFAFIEEE